MSELPSDSPPHAGHTVQTSVSSGPSPENLHKVRNPLSKLSKAAFHRPTTPPAPSESVVGASRDADFVPMSKQSSRLFKITKKAGKLATELASDFAFGTYKDEQVDPQFEEYKLGRLRERAEHYNRDVEKVKQEINEKGTEVYLDHLRFFLDYMDQSEFNDPIDYAITRRDLWLNWYKQFLVNLRDEVGDYEKLVEERKAMLSQPESTYQHIKHDADYKLKTKLHELSSISQPGLVQSLQSSMFNDKRVVLLLLWFLQIIKKLLNQPTMINREVLEALKNFQDAVDPSLEAELCEVCVVTSNKMISSNLKDTPAEEIQYIAEGSILGAHVEFLNGWQVRHDNPQFHTNFVSVTDSLRKVIDRTNRGVLPAVYVDQYPNFDHPILDDQFYEYQLSSDEKKFAAEYSSFTTIASDVLPLRDASQSCVCCPDLALTATESNLKSTFAEFKRVLKPSGYLQLYLWDVENAPGDPKHQSDNEILRQCVWRLLAQYNEGRNSVVNKISSQAVPVLRELGFKKIRFCNIGFPLISTLSEHTDIASMMQTSDSDRTASTASTTQLGYKDPRVNAFFEFYSNYIEFLMFAKILSVFQLVETLKYQAAKEKVTKVGDRETLDLIKLFIDYKLNGCAGKVVQQRFPYLPQRQDAVRSEGVGYSVVLIAEK
ncbi:hypothetical protein KL930_004587 [Ogataea haglerorum]|uniref:Uncharacterized protein n=1 Tax=Ogataea haglerorum TaxID=1937702 RepID=A0AAN6HYT6_9ASCO|nr:uncharacterized protein KL911_000417 [Ogataea haglerorum]KAG7699235.1 hypothetical protein KL915_001527 [Ogataea haglerorum]KAG7710277.1 hypothetical protein KL914_001187 [Ogataea haglerorum]KAG7710942.1 hypothetical protein KL950_000908 [Ogataea haglerorum]KAG7714692.1 hypothetical protein KL913_004462 [Ogataea haglerorum]KAG7715462.1 hypothetical protein KL949_004376 [Ogataea haglerorum]